MFGVRDESIWSVCMSNLNFVSHNWKTTRVAAKSARRAPRARLAYNAALPCAIDSATASATLMPSTAADRMPPA